MNTNNNWEEEFGKLEVCDVMGRITEDKIVQVEDFISNLLTKKDQEHKAELEMIKVEIISKKDMYRNEFTKHEWREVDNDYNKGIKDALAILDSHINKLSTE